MKVQLSQQYEQFDTGIVAGEWADCDKFKCNIMLHDKPAANSMDLISASWLLFLSHIYSL